MSRKIYSGTVQFGIVIKPFSVTAHGDGIWTVEKNWNIYLRRYNDSTDSYAKIFRWAWQFGPIWARRYR